MKTIINITLFLCACGMLNAQNFMSNSDLHDLSNLEQQFKKDPTKLLNTKYVLTNEHNKLYLSLVAKTKDGFSQEQIESFGGQAHVSVNGLAHLKLPLSKINKLKVLEDIEFASLSRKLKPCLDKALFDTHADSVHLGLGNLPQGYDGENILIGVTDWGFDYSSPVFYDSLLQETRILAAWDQYKLSGPSPDNFDYGTEFDTPNELNSVGSDTANIYSYSTHGTHVASIAGGSSVGTAYKGIAPGVQFLFVTFLVDEGAVLDAWEWMYQKSVEEGKRLVINMSWGLYHLGSLDGNSVLSTAISAYTDLGVVFVNSGGNNGNVNFHLKHTFESDTIASRIQFYSYSANPNMWGQSIHSWGEVGETFSNALEIKNTSGQVVAQTPYYSTQNTDTYIDTFLVNEIDTIWYNISADNMHPLNGRPHMRLRVKCTSSAYRVMFKSAANSGTVHNWNVTELTNDVGNWGMPFSAYGTGSMSGDNENGISEPSCSDDVISVAAYASGWVTPTGVTTGGAMASFSSQGPRYDGLMKPDIAAPGVSIGAAISSYTDASFSSVESIEFNTRTYHFAKLSGTSMASPMVAGVAALLLQAKPELSATEVKQILLSTAREDNKTGDLPAEGDPKWGHGKVDAMAALREALELGLSQSNEASSFKVYPNPVRNKLYLDQLHNMSMKAILKDFSGKSREIEIVNGSIDCTEYSAGMYLIEFKHKGQTRQLTFIKH
ncbi:MAG: S8 family peptidase [Crocinitomicaceae bacterium]|nr:S8 family peptidase [Crocinitomicaceae bacterium]